MDVQTNVKRKLRERVEEVRDLLRTGVGWTRTEAARAVCERLGLRDRRGDLQQMGCLRAMRELSAEGLLEIPAPVRGVGARGMRRLKGPAPEPEGVGSKVQDVRGLRLVLVEEEMQMRTWNELIAREHPCATRPMVGRQLRYLIDSDHGLLGAIGFASPAFHLRQRDRWIGWSEQLRHEQLDRVVGLARLLIRPSVRCENLLSQVLRMTAELMPADFERAYGYRPWLLETFVEPQGHDMSAWIAADWLLVGMTRGRGRQDVRGEGGISPKHILVRVLDRAFREHLGIPAIDPLGALKPADGLSGPAWAESELGEADLGDRRLTRRLVDIARRTSEGPGRPFSELISGDRAEASGYYRFIERPDESATTMKAILQPHRDRTLRRMKAQPEMLCIHDTTDLNFSTLSSCTGLGVIGKNQTKTETMGLRLHTSLVVDATDGVPLGILEAQCEANEPPDPDRPKDPRLIPAKQKTSWRWVEGMLSCIEADQHLRDTHVIHLMDREADFYELFHHWKIHSRDDLIVRAKSNRVGDNGEKIFDAVAELEARGALEVKIPRKSIRAKKGKRAPQPPRPARTATVELRWMDITLRPPSYGPSSMHPPVSATLVHACEKSPPEGEKPLEWFLITTIRVDSQDEAARVLGFYAKRWRIEDWHRILKTCCNCEDPCFRDAEHIKRLLAINMVVAWRIHLMTLLGREVPDLPMPVLFSDTEIRVLQMVARREKIDPPTQLAQAIAIVARLGGHYDRNNDPEPGAQVLTRGTYKLMLLCDGVELAETDLSRTSYG